MKFEIIGLKHTFLTVRVLTEIDLRVIRISKEGITRGK